MSTFLVTGGAGFIGSHLVGRLLDLDQKVLVLDNFSTGSLKNLKHVRSHPGLEIVKGSVSNRGALNGMVEAADVVYHLAASVGVRKVMEEPVQTMENNIDGTHSVLRAAKKRGTKVVVASTSEVYGKSVSVPFREDDDLLLGPTSKSRWSYACSKAIDEFLTLAYWEKYRVPTVVVRLFNTIGPRQIGRYGMVVPRFLTQAASGQNLTVYGSGQQTRCFTYVTDIVEWFIRLARLDSAVGEIFNLGNPKEVTITELARKVIDVTGASVGMDFLPYEEVYHSGFEDAARRVPDIGKVRTATGYSPQVDLYEALELTYAWMNTGASERQALLAKAGSSI
jgi:UDP-glucose 4-epimerase